MDCSVDLFLLLAMTSLHFCFCFSSWLQEECRPASQTPPAAQLQRRHIDFEIKLVALSLCVAINQSKYVAEHNAGFISVVCRRRAASHEQTRAHLLGMCHVGCMWDRAQDTSTFCHGGVAVSRCPHVNASWQSFIFCFYSPGSGGMPKNDSASGCYSHSVVFIIVSLS